MLATFFSIRSKMRPGVAITTCTRIKIEGKYLDEQNL